MYKCTDNTQSNFLSFNQPIGLHMNPENRWVKMADAIPWEIFEKKYSRLFQGKNGCVEKPLRLALGSLIIQTKYQYSDRELVDQLTENPYYLVVEMANQKQNLNKHRRTKELLCLMQPVPHQISGIRRISHCSMKPEKNWRLSSSVSVKVMDFQDHVCIAGKPERTTLHLRKQRNAALRKSEQPFVNS